MCERERERGGRGGEGGRGGGQKRPAVLLAVILMYKNIVSTSLN